MTDSDGRRICRVTSAYESPYTAPVVFSAGEKLATGKKEGGWVWCTKRDGESRWVPEAYIEREGGDTAVMRRDYEATELSVTTGEELVMGEEESDWAWCTNQEGRSGWVPVENVEKV